MYAMDRLVGGAHILSLTGWRPRPLQSRIHQVRAQLTSALNKIQRRKHSDYQSRRRTTIKITNAVEVVFIRTLGSSGIGK